MAVPLALTLPGIFSGSSPIVEITGLGSLPVATTVGIGAWGYNRYNRDMERMAEQAHYSDRNADRLIRNIGQSTSTRTTPSTFPSGHAGSPSNPIQLGEVITTPKYGLLGSRLYATTDSVGTAPANPPAAPADTTRTAAPGTTTPSQQPEPNDSTSQSRPSFRERLGDRIAGRSNGQTASGGTTPPNNNQNGSFLRRMIWETNNNNFGQNYWQWRNVGRVGLGLSYPAREYVWPAVGKGIKYMTVGPDSVPATKATPQVPTAQPATADTVPAVTTNQLPNSTITNQGDDFEQWLKSRQTE